MLAQMIKDARERAGRAIKAAQDIAAKMKAEPDKAQELTESFNKAHTEASTAIKDVQQLEREQELEQHATFMAAVPAGQPAHHGMESQAAVPGVSKETHKAAFLDFVRHGEGKARERLAALKPEEQHALLGTQGDLGGFLVPDDFRAEVLKDLALSSVMRGIVRVERTGRSALVLPVIKSATGNATDIYSSDYAGAWKAQGYVTGGTVPPQQNQPTFGQERIPVHDWQPNAIEVTQDLLEDSAANLDSILAEVIAETMGLDEDSAMTNGTGVGQPEGILNGGSPNPSTDLGTSSTITYAGLVALYSALPGQYRQNGKFVMNSATFGKILLLETTAGFPIFPPNSLPGTLFSKPIVFNEFMPSIGASAKTIVFGDFSRAYILVDRAELRVQRLAERFAPNIGLLPIKRTGGQVVRPRALRIGKHAA